MNKDKFTQRIDDWLFFADEDLRLAEVALEEEIYHGTCFHAQQAAEKAIKAYLLRKLGKVSKIHHLTGLLDLDFKIKKDFLELIDKVEFLDQFYIPTRYPDAFPGSLPEGLPDRGDALRALECAKEIVDFVKKKLAEK